MSEPLSISDIKLLLSEAEYSFRHEECATCECYLGYVTQLKIDSGPEAQGNILKEYKPDRDKIHSCLGCDPCPPGTLYANYLRKRTSRLKNNDIRILINKPVGTGASMKFPLHSLSLLPIILILILLVWRRTAADIAGLAGWVCSC